MTIEEKIDAVRNGTLRLTSTTLTRGEVQQIARVLNKESDERSADACRAKGDIWGANYYAGLAAGTLK